jgi:hypothetical protein
MGKSQWGWNLGSLLKQAGLRNVNVTPNNCIGLKMDKSGNLRNFGENRDT